MHVIRYYYQMIISFANKETEIVFRGEFSSRFPPHIQNKALNKLRILNNVNDLEQLRVPPSNRLHLLSGDRKGQYSISINDQWRICFQWKSNSPEQVEITDYH